MGGLREAEKKTFVKLVDSLCGRHSRWEIWKDMIWIFATTISNAVDGRHRDAREKRYMDIAKHYSAEEMNTFAELFGQLVNAMDDGGHRDFLGELFMEIGLGNDAGGQFFTPYSLCKAMAEIGMPNAGDMIERDGWISICDPSSGAGATLIAAADILYNELHINYQQHALFAAQEIDYTTGLMCYIQMSLYGMAGYVHIGNTLTDPMTGHVLFCDGGEDTWYTPMYFSDVWHGRRVVAQMDHILRGVNALERNDAQTDEDGRKHQEHEKKKPEAHDTPVVRVVRKEPDKKKGKARKNEQITLWEVMT